MLLSIELMEIHFLGKHKSFDATVLQQTEVGKNIMPSQRNGQKSHRCFMKNANRTTVATHVGGSWEKKDKQQDPVLLPRI